MTERHRAKKPIDKFKWNSKNTNNLKWGRKKKKSDRKKTMGINKKSKMVT